MDRRWCRGLAAFLAALPLVAAAAAGVGGDAAPGSTEDASTARQGWVDATLPAGLGGFLHAGFLGDAETRPKFVETMGPGACWLDVDRDGLLDLFLVNGRYHTHPEKEEALQPTSRLYRNTGDGFVDATTSAGLALRAWGQGCAAADYDNDGDTDLFVTTYGANHLYRNDNDGRFSDVTSAMGVAGELCDDVPCWSSSAVWLDADRDGCLDLYVNNFAAWTFTTPGQNAPDAVPPQRNIFYRGGCGDAFLEATSAAGLDRVAHTWSSVSYDLDLDGWPDLYDSNDGDPNDLWLNNGDGTFRLVNGTASDPRAGMGTAVGDLTRDGRPDIVTTNYVQQTNGIFVGRAGGGYEDIGATPPFLDARPYSGWAAMIYDYDHDARQDLVVVNSMTEDITPFVPVPVAQPILVYRSLGQDGFAQANMTLGEALARDYVGRGAAWADYDNDGDVDVLVAQAGENPVHLLRSDRAPGNFLSIDLVGTGSNVSRDALGARVSVDAAGIEPQVREKTLQMGYLSTNDPRVHFGLADAIAANVTVWWPDGSEETFANVSANAFVRIVQGAPTPIILAKRPVASATGPVEITRLAAAHFRASLDAPIARAAWEFGDGASAACADGVCLDASGARVGTMDAEGAHVTHAFATTGAYEVHVALTDDAGRVTAKRVEGLVTGSIRGDLSFTKAAYGALENPSGVARVFFENDAPVAGATVAIEIRYSFWNTPEALVLPALPRSVRETAGYRTHVIEGLTDADGTFAFQVPLWWRSPLAAAPVAFNVMGDYVATLDGAYRGGTFDGVQASYQVLPHR